MHHVLLRLALPQDLSGARGRAPGRAVLTVARGVRAAGAEVALPPRAAVSGPDTRNAVHASVSMTLEENFPA